MKRLESRVASSQHKSGAGDHCLTASELLRIATVSTTVFHVQCTSLTGQMPTTSTSPWKWSGVPIDTQTSEAAQTNTDAAKPQPELSGTQSSGGPPTEAMVFETHSQTERERRSAVAARKEPTNTQKPSAMPRRSFNYSTYPRPTNSRHMHARRWYIYSCYPSGAHPFFSTTPPPDSAHDSAPTVRPRTSKLDTSKAQYSTMARDYGYSDDDPWDPAGIKPLIICMCKVSQIMKTYEIC